MDVDQEAIWREVKSQLALSQVKSKTGDLHAIYSHWVYILFMFTAKFRPRPNQIGMLAFLNKNIWYADFFINEATLNKAYDGLIRSYAVEVLARTRKAEKKHAVKEAEREHADDVLSALRLAKLKEYKYGENGGQGTYFLNSKRAVGTALMEDSKCLYASVCSK
ncbi:ARPP-1 family domain-containing protein [bacterium]